MVEAIEIVEEHGQLLAALNDDELSSSERLLKLIAEPIATVLLYELQDLDNGWGCQNDVYKLACTIVGGNK